MEIVHRRINMIKKVSNDGNNSSFNSNVGGTLAQAKTFITDNNNIQPSLSQMNSFFAPNFRRSTNGDMMSNADDGSNYNLRLRKTQTNNKIAK